MFGVCASWACWAAFSVATIGLSYKDSTGVLVKLMCGRNFVGVAPPCFSRLQSEQCCKADTSCMEDTRQAERSLR